MTWDVPFFTSISMYLVLNIIIILFNLHRMEKIQDNSTYSKYYKQEQYKLNTAIIFKILLKV